MNPICRSSRVSPVAALLLSLSLVACGGSPAGMEGGPVAVAQNRSAALDSAKEVIVQPPKAPDDRIVAHAASTDPRPDAAPSAGCPSQADEPAPIDGGREVLQEPESEVVVHEWVPEPAGRDLTDDLR